MDKVVRIGIIGTGTMGKIYANLCHMNPKTELIAVCGNTQMKTDDLVENTTAKAYYHGDYEAFFQGNCLDAVILCTPEEVRLEPLRLCISNDVAILLEKPLADNYRTGIKVLDLLSESNSVIDLCYPLRYSSRFAPLLDKSSRSVIGELKHSSARRDSNQVRASRVLGNTDLAFWLTPHDIDIFLAYAPSEVQSVRAYSKGVSFETSDYIVANIHCVDGFLFTLQSSWACPPMSGKYPGASHEVWGDEGYIRIDDSEMNVNFYMPDSVVTSTDTYEDFIIGDERYGYFRALFDNFIARLTRPGVINNSSVLKSAELNLKICQMISISLSDRREVLSSEPF